MKIFNSETDLPISNLPTLCSRDKFGGLLFALIYTQISPTDYPN